MNVLEQSPIFSDIIDGVHWSPHYLADGIIYPEYATSVKAFTYPHNDKESILRHVKISKKLYTACFWLLFGIKEVFAVIANPSTMSKKYKIRDMMYAYIIYA